MRVVAGLLIVLVTIVVYLRVRAGKRRDAQLATAEAASAAIAAKNVAPKTTVK
jgi:hypothetical protein